MVIEIFFIFSKRNYLNFQSLYYIIFPVIPSAEFAGITIWLSSGTRPSAFLALHLMMSGRLVTKCFRGIKIPQRGLVQQKTLPLLNHNVTINGVGLRLTSHARPLLFGNALMDHVMMRIVKLQHRCWCDLRNLKDRILNNRTSFTLTDSFLKLEFTSYSTFNPTCIQKSSLIVA